MSHKYITGLKIKLKKARANNRLKEISEYACSLASVLGDNEEYEEALLLYKESLKACESIGDKYGVALAQRMIAETNNCLGYFEEALKFVHLFLKYAVNEDDKVEEQRGLVLRGLVYFTHAEYLANTEPERSQVIEKLLKQSLESYQKSYAICNSELKEVNEKEVFQMKARLLQNISLVLIRQGNFDEGEKCLVKSIKISSVEKFNDTEWISYNSLGDLYSKKRDFKKALDIYNKAFNCACTTQMKTDSLLGIAKSYLFLDNFEETKMALKRAYKLKMNPDVKEMLKHVLSTIKTQKLLNNTPETNITERKKLYRKLGNLFLNLKLLKKAMDNYMNLLKCCRKNQDNYLNIIICIKLIIKTFAEGKEYSKALFYAHQELQLYLKNSPEKTCYTYLKTGKLHELKGSDYEDISYAYFQAKDTAEKYDNAKIKMKSLKRIINIGKKFNKPNIVEQAMNELKDLKAEKQKNIISSESESDDNFYSFDSDICIDEDLSTDSEFENVLKESETEQEEFDRPRERCKRTKYSIKRNEKGETELHIATIKGNIKKVQNLISQGHPVNIRDGAGWTPLHEACNHGYVDIVKILVENGADVNDKGGSACDLITPLHDAAINGQHKVIEYLIEKGASTLVLNKHGLTPLHCLLAWRKNSALDAAEEKEFNRIARALQSPLDCDNAKRNSSVIENEQKKKKNSNVDSNNGGSSLIINNQQISYKFSKNKNLERKNINNITRRKRPSIIESDEDSDFSDKSESKECKLYKEVMNGFRRSSKKYKASDSMQKNNLLPALIDENDCFENRIVNDDFEDSADDLKNDEDCSSCTSIESLGKNRMEQKYEKVIEENIAKKQKKKIRLDNKKYTDEKRSEKVVKKKSFENLSMINENPSAHFDENWDDDVDEIISNLVIPSSETKNDKKSPNCDISISQLDPENLIFSPFQDNSESQDISYEIFNKRSETKVKKSELNTLNFEWLIQTVKKRYPIIDNPDCYILIKTDKKPLIAESDFLSILAEDEKIEFKVMRWKNFKLDERYEKICTIKNHADMRTGIKSYSFTHEVHPDVLEIFKNQTLFRCYNLSNLKLSSISLIPVCKALKYESFIQMLDLSNNDFGDQGIELIIKILELCLIEKLDISGCYVTSLGIHKLNDFINIANKISLNGLLFLNLCCNPITDDAFNALENIIKKLPNLAEINVSNCKLNKILPEEDYTTVKILQGGLLKHN